MSTRIVVLGAGYAGLRALARLAGRPGLEVRVVDERPASENLPLLPDLIGRELPSRHLRRSLAAYAAGRGAVAVRDRIVGIDLAGRRLRGLRADHPFDAAVLAAGAVTDFHGLSWAERHAWSLRSVEQALGLRRRLAAAPDVPLVICGGGYTGVELAAAAWRAGRRRGRSRCIVLVEATAALCPSLPPWARRHLRSQLRALGIRVHTGTTVAGADAGGVRLGDGTEIPRAVLAWTAGTRPAPCLDGLPVERGAQGRLLLPADLRVAPGVYAAGDAVAVAGTDGAPRMSVHAARSTGARAAENLARELAGREPRPWRPADPGWVVPLGHGRACGEILGRRLTGRLPLALHYALGAVTPPGPARRLGLLAALWSPRAIGGDPG